MVSVAFFKDTLGFGVDEHVQLLLILCINAILLLELDQRFHDNNYEIPPVIG